MKKVIVIVLAVALLTIGSGVGVALANPAVTVYANDKPGWEAAVGFYQTENFSDTTFNPGVSVDTDVGYVTGGLWWDRVDDGDWYGDGIVRDTTWIFANPIIAWGGTFDLYNPGGPGSSIDIELVDGTTISVGTIPNTTAGTFWGFVSDTPFTKVHLKDAALSQGACETYEMDDMVYAARLSVDIDIKPGSFPNSINLKSKGVIPVAVLGSATFDVTQINPDTLAFCPALGDAKPAHDPPCHFEDVNGDGYLDLVSHYRTQDTGINPGQPAACLIFKTYGGTPYRGCDSIRTVPSK